MDWAEAVCRLIPKRGSGRMSVRSVRESESISKILDDDTPWQAAGHTKSRRGVGVPPIRRQCQLAMEMLPQTDPAHP